MTATAGEGVQEYGSRNSTETDAEADTDRSGLQRHGRPPPESASQFNPAGAAAGGGSGLSAAELLEP